MIDPHPPPTETGSQQAVAIDGMRLRLIINRASISIPTAVGLHKLG